MNNKNPIAPIINIPSAEIFTMFPNSSILGFLVILSTLLHSVIKDFNLDIIRLSKKLNYIKLTQKILKII